MKTDRVWIINNPSYSAVPAPLNISMRALQRALRARCLPDGTRIPLADEAYVGVMGEDGYFHPTHKVTESRIVRFIY